MLALFFSDTLDELKKGLELTTSWGENEADNCQQLQQFRTEAKEQVAQEIKIVHGLLKKLLNIITLIWFFEPISDTE